MWYVPSTAPRHGAPAHKPVSMRHGCGDQRGRGAGAPLACARCNGPRSGAAGASGAHGAAGRKERQRHPGWGLRPWKNRGLNALGGATPFSHRSPSGGRDGPNCPGEACAPAGPMAGAPWGGACSPSERARPWGGPHAGLLLRRGHTSVGPGAMGTSSRSRLWRAGGCGLHWQRRSRRQTPEGP
jgi:hypothetical protein